MSGSQLSGGQLSGGQLSGGQLSGGQLLGGQLLPTPNNCLIKYNSILLTKYSDESDSIAFHSDNEPYIRRIRIYNNASLPLSGHLNTKLSLKCKIKSLKTIN